MSKDKLLQLSLANSMQTTAMTITVVMHANIMVGRSPRVCFVRFRLSFYPEVISEMAC